MWEMRRRSIAVGNTRQQGYESLEIPMAQNHQATIVEEMTLSHSKVRDTMVFYMYPIVHSSVHSLFNTETQNPSYLSCI